MNKDKDFLGTEPVGKLMFRLALPTITAQLINMLYNIIDRIYIGHIPGNGALALTGVGVCMPLIMIISAFAALVGGGGAPRASIAMGKNDLNTAEHILGNCFFLQILISIILTVILLFGNRTFLLAFGASENTIEYAVNYMNIYAVGTIFVQLTLGMNMFITTQGFAKTGMLSVLIGAVMNIVLDPLFIFAFHLCVALGIATFIMQASESIISVCFNSSLLKYGGDIAVGAMTILTSVMQFAMLPLQGLGQGAQPVLSYNYGAKNGDRVKKAFRLLLTASLCYSTLLWAFIMLFPQVFAEMFTSDSALLGFTKSALRIYCACLLLFGIQIACQMAFTSFGKAKASIAVAVTRKFILLLPLIYLLPHILTGDKTNAVYMAEPIADFLAVSFTTVLFTFQFRKVLKELEG